MSLPCWMNTSDAVGIARVLFAYYQENYERLDINDYNYKYFMGQGDAALELAGRFGLPSNPYELEQFAFF